MKKYQFGIIRYAFIGLFPVLLSGCSVGPDYKRPKLDLPMISQTRADAEVEKFLSEKWWGMFNDSTLNKLEEIAIKKNSDIKQAMAAIEEARAAAGVSNADYLPSIGLNGSGKNVGPSKKTTGSNENVTTYNVNVGISYEIDFWGKYRRANEAARANLMASHAAKEAVLLTITSEVAKTYFMIRALDAKLAIAKRTLKTREESYKVYKSRFENGYCTELDYLRISSEMESVKSTVLNLEAASERAENALSALIGVSPNVMMTRKTSRISSLEKLRVPSNIPNGLPSNLIERRPDVAQAEGQLIAANAIIGQTIADNFPSFSLTGMFGFESKALRTLFRNGTETHLYGLNLSLPVFTAGKISSMGNMARAKYKQMLAIYEKTVSTAFKETLDALVTNRKNHDIVISRTRQTNSLKRSYEIAKIQKESGLIGLIDLLDVERGLLAAEMDLVEALEKQLDAVVDLCKALGGGWKYKCVNKKL